MINRITTRKKLLLALIFILPFELFSQTSLNTKIAINFPFRDPETASFKSYFNLLVGLKVKLIRQLTFGDVFWKQIEATNNNWTFSKADSAIINPYGIKTIPTLFSMFGEDTVGFQVPWRATTKKTGGWKLLDSNDTKDYLTTVINRYKNYNKYWEIGNELNSHDHGPTGFSAAELPAFLKLNYRWIKAIDPEATIVLPGMLGTCGVPMTSAYSWLRSFLKAGGGNTFDIMNYHDYNSWWTLPLHLDSIKAVLKEFGLQKKIWVSECSISSDNTSPITPTYSSPDEQTADTWRRPTVTFGGGLDIFYWQSLWSSGGASEWRLFGLTDPYGKKKKAYHAFKLFIEKLDNFTSIEKISTGVINDNNNSGGSGLWVYKYIASDGSIKFVLWSSPNQTYEISGLTKSKATVTVINPTTITADGETVTWSKSQINVTGGKAVVNLTGMPILVEDGKTGNTAPGTPTITFPLNNSTNIDYNVNLTWTCSDPDGDSLKYNIYLDQLNPPMLRAASNITANSFRPVSLKKNTAYYWKIVAKDGVDSTQSTIYKFTTGMTSEVENENVLPATFVLFQNYPNSFNPVTKIKFGLPASCQTKLTIYDLLGRAINTLIDKALEAGYHEVEFDARNLTSGIYLYTIEAGGFKQTKKMLLIK